MLDIRSPLIWAAAPAGLALAAAGWLLVGPGLIGPRLDAQSPPAADWPAGELQARSAADAVSVALANPIFLLTTGPGAVKDPSLSLTGLARSPAHTAALISIDGKPASWLALGETRDGVTLQEVESSAVVVDTLTGFKTVPLGGAGGSSGQATAAGADPTAAYRAPNAADSSGASQ